MIDPRRFNDVIKIAGSAVGAVALFGPVIAKPHASLSALLLDMLAVLPAAVGLFMAGLGTRGKGLEYQDVADAKAVAKVAASILPPPPPIVKVDLSPAKTDATPTL
jgi:hypothetical protein